MSFDPSNIEAFLAHFENNKTEIRHFKGCQLLELYRDQKDSNVFFTYSYWNHETDLERYRQSDLFKKVWSQTKPLFIAKPEAWSLDKIVSIK